MYRYIHLNNTNNIVFALNTAACTMNQHQSHTNSLGLTLNAFRSKLYVGPYKSCTHDPQKTKNERGSQSMTIIEDRERGNAACVKSSNAVNSRSCLEALSLSKKQSPSHCNLAG